MTRRPPTLDEVALRAGVSVGTVSRVINNRQHVSTKARQAVESAVAELGYVPNVAARSLASQRRGAVVLAISSDDPALFANLFFAEVITGVNAVIEETDLELLLVLAASERGRARLARILKSRGADGVMLLALRENDPLAKVAEAGGVPVVHGGRPLDRAPRWYVDADNRGGARQAVEYLISTGRRAIATVTGPQDMHAGVSRYLGFREAVALAGLKDHRVAHADFSEAGGAAAMARLLDEHPDLDAVFVASDVMAAGALRVLRERGRAVPEDVAVVGFNDILTARHTQPALTTIHQPIVALGREMTRMLVRVLAGEEPTPLILPTELVIRGSA
ncbi:LacI family DNA-binding transcriptional regulator [Streptomyces sp. NBC_00620]|uniref:LacI family DNA-binding transcriptional regulator n=1 Tax=unclassified Streptomyces TaxID=2593676 RepID=UPI00225460CB|nr:LacI family DNA-binding transcriptional regulator [Streptomyces sp. NBC_00620]MCX4978660.1 LacI family transcriptional regulator [Streptomyces sp. NBC_00620]WUC15087.1 LacI family transcriptional regulator [Streptomyces sp. NBC_00564]